MISGVSMLSNEDETLVVPPVEFIIEEKER
jgi:hypothetical protein